jgi:ribosome maturation factor RimP
MAGIQVSDEKMLALLEPVIESLGYELVDVECRVAARDGMLRVFIDAELGITLADCEIVSRQISAWLDVEDPIPGQYRLEVSSPGLDRVLRTQTHFERFVGEEVKVELRQALEGRRRYRGKLQAAQEGKIVVNVDGVAYELPLNMIETARLVPVLE